MKKLYFTFIFSILAPCILAQETYFDEQNQYLDKARLTNGGLYSHLLDSVFIYTFQNELDSSLFAKSILSYNDEGKLILSISYDNENAPTQKMEILYEENTETRTYYKFSVDEQTWQHESQFIETYDNNLLLSETRIEWKEGAWQHKFKDSYEYNENGQKIQETHFSWDEIAQIWTPHSTVEIIYDNQGREILEIVQWVIDGQLKYFRKTEYLYSELETTETSYIWEPDDWMKDYKIVETRTEDGEWKEKVRYSFDNATNQWDTATYYTYSYYPDGKQKRMTYLHYHPETKEIRFSVSYEDFYQPGIEPPVIRHHYADDLVTVDRKTYYYYTSKVTGMEPNLTKTSLFLSPNPATQEITLNFAREVNEVQLDIINLDGRSVFSKLVPSNQPINIQGLPAGILLYKIGKNGNLISSGKFVKK